MFIMALYWYSYFYYLYQNCTNYTLSQGEWCGYGIWYRCEKFCYTSHKPCLYCLWYSWYRKYSYFAFFSPENLEHKFLRY